MGRATGRVHGTKPALLPNFTIAYQPIVNVHTQRVVAYEALARGCDGRTYPQMVAEMDEETCRRFQRKAALESIRRAMELGLRERGASLCINMHPDLATDAVNAEFLRDAAMHFGLPVGRILVEMTEDHRLTTPQLRAMIECNAAAGFVTGMDDFGSGYSGLNMLVACRPQVLKLDRELVRGIDQCTTRQKIVAAFAEISHSLQMVLVAEGVETEEECATLRDLGLDLMQGYLFSYPIVDALPCKDVWGVKDGAENCSGHGIWAADAFSWLRPRLDADSITLRAECA